jgi:chemotaxis protein MotB
VSGGGPRRRRAEEHHEEEHENHERWLVSYADMMTLLMVLFIVMFAISAVDVKKFAALKHGLTAGFGAPVAMLRGGDDLLDPGGAVAPDSVDLKGTKEGQTPQTPIDPAQVVNPEAVAELARTTTRAGVKEEAEHLKQIRARLKAALSRNGMPNGATFRFDERGLIVTIATDDVLFDSGQSELRLQGRRILSTLAPTLRSVPNRLTVDGHTNSVPIQTARYPSNWELSADRASHVLRFLVDRHRMPTDKISSSAFADTRPLVPKSEPEALIRNRRVEIVVLAQVDDAARRALVEEATDAPLRPPPAD